MTLPFLPQMRPRVHLPWQRGWRPPPRPGQVLLPRGRDRRLRVHGREEGQGVQADRVPRDGDVERVSAALCGRGVNVSPNWHWIHGLIE